MKGKAWLFVAVVLLIALASGAVFAKEAPGGEILPVDAGNYNDYGGGDSGWSGDSDWPYSHYIKKPSIEKAISGVQV